ncbi:hypothetical protein P7B02_18030 [Caulobacter segnis]|uniref:hypothetical protein n=1 Tax=Caulobacter segnis TaxID=88688 RepID=UPI0024108BF3|nr:hypothetical protein [Caulobacter segnis]MDG2523431.1 hypothetical protein [Caulobacter segnis]
MNWKKIVLGVAGAVCLASWIALGAGLAMGVDKPVRVVLVVIAAFATEALFWSVAAVLGVSVVQARKQIWAKLTAPFRGAA